MIKEIDFLKQNNRTLGIKTIEQDKMLQNIFNSRSWKLISLFRNILNFFR